MKFPPPTPGSALDNNTAIEWDQGAGAPAGTHYEIVWRTLAAPDWQRSIPADRLGTVTGSKFGATPEGHFSAELPVSKDNVIFGVVAVDAHGHRSPAVVPWPARPE